MAIESTVYLQLSMMEQFALYSNRVLHLAYLQTYQWNIDSTTILNIYPFTTYVYLLSYKGRYKIKVSFLQVSDTSHICETF